MIDHRHIQKVINDFDKFLAHTKTSPKPREIHLPVYPIRQMDQFDNTPSMFWEKAESIDMEPHMFHFLMETIMTSDNPVVTQMFNNLLAITKLQLSGDDSKYLQVLKEIKEYHEKVATKTLEIQQELERYNRVKVIHELETQKMLQDVLFYTTDMANAAFEAGANRSVWQTLLVEEIKEFAHHNDEEQAKNYFLESSMHFRIGIYEQVKKAHEVWLRDQVRELEDTLYVKYLDQHESTFGVDPKYDELFAFYANNPDTDEHDSNVVMSKELIRLDQEYHEEMLDADHNARFIVMNQTRRIVAERAKNYIDGYTGPLYELDRIHE